MRRRSTVGGALEMFSLPLPLPLPCRIFYYSAVVTIALSCTICELFDVE